MTDEIQGRSETGFSNAGLDDPGRRYLLRNLLALSSFTLIPWRFAYAAAGDVQGAFQSVSEFITGRRALDGGLEGAIFQALSARDPNFADEITRLQALINGRPGLRPEQLDGVLKNEFPDLAAPARQVASGWFLGVVGSGFDAVSVAYQQALNAGVVGDVLKPQGFCLGGPGVWAEPPQPTVR